MLMLGLEKIYVKTIQIRRKKKIENEKSFKRNIFKIYFYNFFMGFYLLSGVIVPFYIIWGHLSFFEFMFFQSYYGLIIVLFEIPCGAFSDHVSRKASLFLSGVLSTSTMLIYLNNPSIILFLMGETVFGLSEAFIAGSNEAILFDSLKKIGREKEYSKYFARTNVLFLIAMAGSAPLGTFIVFYFSLHSLICLMIFPYVIGTVISISFHEPERIQVKKKINFFNTIKMGFNEFKSNKILRVLVYDMTIIETLIFILLYTYQFYLYQLSVPLIYFGFISSALNVIQILFLNFLPKSFNLIKNRKNMLTINTIIPGIAYILIGFTFLNPIFICLLIVIIFGFGLTRYIIFSNGINSQINVENRATTLNVINTIKVLIRIIIFPIIGYLAEWDLSVVFIILGILIVIFALRSKVKKEYL